jgi:hypothetical protein
MLAFRKCLQQLYGVYRAVRQDSRVARSVRRLQCPSFRRVTFSWGNTLQRSVLSVPVVSRKSLEHEVLAAAIFIVSVREGCIEFLVIARLLPALVYPAVVQDLPV